MVPWSANKIVGTINFTDFIVFGRESFRYSVFGACGRLHPVCPFLKFDMIICYAEAEPAINTHHVLKTSHLCSKDTALSVESSR